MGNTPANRARLMALVAKQDATAMIGDPGLDEDDGIDTATRLKVRQTEVAPHAHEWHLQNAYIPIEIIEGLSALGVFGLTIPEESAAWAWTRSPCRRDRRIVARLYRRRLAGTRSEIAAELILCAAPTRRSRNSCPKIASGEILPTAVFTEPNTGSDLASLRTRATREGETYKISGNKTWITHPVRADLMTVLARTNPSEPGYKGLSMFLAKSRAARMKIRPRQGMSGGEIEVLGYRGMKEYEIAFDGFDVPRRTCWAALKDRASSN